MFKLKQSLFFLIAFLIIRDKSIAKSEGDMDETAIFKIDKKKNEIVSLSENAKNYLKLKFISVTTDQPIYWPDEDVHLKVLLPLNPEEEVEITLQKKDATPKNLGKFTLNEAGILIEKILSGKDKRIEVGEYRVDVATADKKLKSSTTFSVVEGSLGALSFAHNFEELTNPKDFEKVKGGFFLGNASGAGMRWGNGLNVKNEIRVLNKPYSGNVTINSRCYLPGCNGIIAGPSIKTNIKNGLLEVTLDVGGHSGPFEIEVITPKGNLRHLFGRSGHVERQTIPLCANLTNKFSATLAPYEGTTPVYGRGIYIAKEKERGDDPFELKSAICNNSNEIELFVKKEIFNPKLFVFYPEKSDDFKVLNIDLPNKLEKEKKITIKCASPYTFVAIGGFERKNFYEGWAIAFTESPLEVEISAPSKGIPLQSYDIEIKSFDRFMKKGISIYGILEVFDNRVPSKSAKEPLISSIGDSFRELSNYLSTWREWSGITNEEVYEMKAPPTPMMKAVGGRMSLGAKASALKMEVSPSYPEGAEESEDITETIREGEKKVVFCGIVKTDNNGVAKVNVKLPPQMGRCKIRFVAINKFDYLEKVKDIDVKKENYVEVNIMPLLLPNSKIFGNAYVVNNEKENLKLKIFGAGLKKTLFYDIEPGSKEIEFEVRGKDYGTLHLQLFDNKGKILDKREIEIKNISSFPVTFGDVIISSGNPIVIEKGKRVAIYSNPAQLLQGIIMNIVTTMYSWFGHSEAISASCVVRAILIRAIEDRIIDDEGLRDTLKADLIKGVKDLYEKFYNKNNGLFYPYPGIKENPLWSIWSSRNLNTMLQALETSPDLKNEFGESIKIAKEMVDGVHKEMKKRKVSIAENALYDPESGQDVVPVEIDGKVIYRVIIDDAVAKWFVDKMLPILDLPQCQNVKDINLNFAKAYDIYRFLRAFERTGSIFYLLLNAKALLLKGDKNFYPVFNKIARGLILTQEPGLIQGPALLGGVYSSPQTLIKFLDLLITMAKDKRIVFSPEISIKNGKEKRVNLSDRPFILEEKMEDIVIIAPEFVAIRFDEVKEINLYDYLENKAFFNIALEKNSFKMGEDGNFLIELDKDKDPAEYYAIVAIPSVLSLRQTEDLLSDYKGQLLYGQKTGGGERIQLVTLPFRGSRKMILKIEASQKGESEGYVLVRHISNPDIISTLKIPFLTVR